MARELSGMACIAAQDREAEGPGGAAVVVVVGAHYRPSAATREEGLLHAVSVRRSAGRPSRTRVPPVVPSSGRSGLGLG
jgi:hypothetical protein